MCAKTRADTHKGRRPEARVHAKRLFPPIILAAGLALVAFGSTAASNNDAADYRLSSLRVFNRVVLLVKEQYVEPQRIRPKEMLLAALDAVEKSVPEVLVDEAKNDEVVVVVGTERRAFPLDD